MKGGIRLATAALILATPVIASPSPLHAQDLRNGYFVHEFWAQLEPMAGGLLPNSGPNAPNTNKGAPDSSNGPLSKDRAVTQILKEAQYVFSGMIYGYSFTYTPPDSTRGIAESFDLSPVAQIKWGDPDLKVLDTRVEQGRLVARVMYTLAPFQENWTKGWDSNIFPNASGRGSSRYFLSYDQKMASYKNAIMEAIRGYLRQRIFNKPRKVAGQVVLRGSPYTIIDAGRYVTTLTVKLRIDKVEPYTVY